MVLRGRVQNGVVVLDNGTSLPEGAEVSVSFPTTAQSPSDTPATPVEFPLVHSKRPGSVNLTAERIVEILDNEDISAGR